MYHPPSKKKALAARILTYGLMTISVITMVAISLMYTLGYRFDTKERQLELNGLVQFVSTPNNAVVEIDGVRHNQATPTKETVSPGQHEFVMWREGYETWRKAVTIEKGMLTWLNYTRLVPKERSVQSVASLPAVAQTLASPDERFMAVIADVTKPTINFYNLSADDVNETSFSLPKENYSEADTPKIAHRFVIDQWERDGRYLLLKHTYGKKIEWIVIDRQDGRTVSNVTQVFDVAITKAYFADTNATVLYAMVDGNVRKINIPNQTISAPLVSKVSEFQLYGDVVGYVQTPDPKTGKRQAGVVKDGQKPVVLYTSSSPLQHPVHIALSHYFDKDYVAVSDGAKVVAYGGNFPANQTERQRFGYEASFYFSTDIGWLQLSPSGRFIVAQNEASYVSYDLEREELSPVAMLTGTTTPRPLEWLDDYYVWSDRSSGFTMREFDGANQHTINAVATGFDATLSPSGRWLYTIGKQADGQYQLQRVRMILP